MAILQKGYGGLTYGERVALPSITYTNRTARSNTRSPRKLATSNSAALEQAQRRALELDLDQKRLAVEAERRRLETEAETRLQNQDDRNYWNYLTKKSALASKIGQHGANWSAGDEHMRDYLAVKLGLLKPIQRKVGR